MASITHLHQLNLNQIYSYADYLTWHIDEAIELIKGKIMLMSPAPNVEHQRITRKLLVTIDNFLKGKRCEVFPAPFDVRLYNRKKSILANQDIHTVVQPDLCVVCNPDSLDKQGCNGAPDWIIEILSQGNSKRELKIKYELYQESGVSEYWLVYPEQRAIHQFVLDTENRYQLKQMFTDDDKATPFLLPDLAIDVTELFGD
jgi:Uma2 family endonuclease